MAMMKKPMAKKSMVKKSAKKAAPMMMSGSMMKAGGKVTKAKLGTTTSESTKSPNYKDSAAIYGKQFDDYSAKAVNAMGTSKASGLRKKAAEAREKETKFSKKAYGTTPGLPQKKMGGKMSKKK
jgi:hypothetical protein